MALRHGRQPRNYIGEEAFPVLENMREYGVQLPVKVQSSVGAEEDDETDVAFYGNVMLAPC